MAVAWGKRIEVKGTGPAGRIEGVVTPLGVMNGRTVSELGLARKGYVVLSKGSVHESFVITGVKQAPAARRMIFERSSGGLSAIRHAARGRIRNLTMRGKPPKVKLWERATAESPFEFGALGKRLLCRKADPENHRKLKENGYLWLVEKALQSKIEK
jgi:hypothetical protein